MSTFSQFTGGGGIKSIQRGTITMVGAATSGTATISSVTTSKTELRFLGSRSADNGGTSGNGFCTVVLTNATTITATRDLGGISASVSWELTEWN
jgi:hypothetical protein